jgi:hypothetical protein
MRGLKLKMRFYNYAKFSKYKTIFKYTQMDKSLVGTVVVRSFIYEFSLELICFCIFKINNSS